MVAIRGWQRRGFPGQRSHKRPVERAREGAETRRVLAYARRRGRRRASLFSRTPTPKLVRRWGVAVLPGGSHRQAEGLQIRAIGRLSPMRARTSSGLPRRRSGFARGTIVTRQMRRTAADRDDRDEVRMKPRAMKIAGGMPDRRLTVGSPVLPSCPGALPRQIRNEAAACSTSMPQPWWARARHHSLLPRSTNGVGFIAYDRS